MLWDQPSLSLAPLSWAPSFLLMCINFPFPEQCGLTRTLLHLWGARPPCSPGPSTPLPAHRQLCGQRVLWIVTQEKLPTSEHQSQLTDTAQPRLSTPSLNSLKGDIEHWMPSFARATPRRASRENEYDILAPRHCISLNYLQNWQGKAMLYAPWF